MELNNKCDSNRIFVESQKRERGQTWWHAMMNQFNETQCHCTTGLPDDKSASAGTTFAMWRNCRCKSWQVVLSAIELTRLVYDLCEETLIVVSKWGLRLVNDIPVWLFLQSWVFDVDVWSFHQDQGWLKIQMSDNRPVWFLGYKLKSRTLEKARSSHAKLLISAWRVCIVWQIGTIDECVTVLMTWARI